MREWKPTLKYIKMAGFHVRKKHLPERHNKNFQIKNPALPTFPPVLHWSIMGGAAFHFRVRDGIGWGRGPWSTRRFNKNYWRGRVLDVRAKIRKPIAAITSNKPTSLSDGEYLCIRSSILLAFRLYHFNIILGSAKLFVIRQKVKNFSPIAWDYCVVCQKMEAIW